MLHLGSALVIREVCTGCFLPWAYRLAMEKNPGRRYKKGANPNWTFIRCKPVWTGVGMALSGLEE